MFAPTALNLTISCAFYPEFFHLTPLSQAFSIYYAEKLSWMLSPSQKLHTYTQEEVPSQKVVES